MNSNTYQSSGTAPMGGIFLTLLVGGAASAVMGAIYSYLIFYIPLIYVNFLVGGGFAFGIAVVVSFGLRAGKVRNQFIGGLLGLVCALVGFYVAWAVDPIAREGFGKVGFQSFDPGKLWPYVQNFYETGRWTFKGDEPVTGIMLGIVWALEAAIIVGGGAVFALGAQPDEPFCETCDTWTDVETDVQRLAIEKESEQAMAQVAEGNLDVLNDLTIASPDNPVFLRIDLAACPSCTASRFASVTAVTVTADSDGNRSEEELPLIQHLIIQQDRVEALRSVGNEPEERDDEEEQTG